MFAPSSPGLSPGSIAEPCGSLRKTLQRTGSRENRKSPRFTGTFAITRNQAEPPGIGVARTLHPGYCAHRVCNVIYASDVIYAGRSGVKAKSCRDPWLVFDVIYGVIRH